MFKLQYNMWLDITLCEIRVIKDPIFLNIENLCLE